MTPLAPRDPYSAIAAASFNTEKVSISFGLIDLKLSLLEGKPSITYNGYVLPLNVPTPRIITIGLALAALYSQQRLHQLIAPE